MSRNRTLVWIAGTVAALALLGGTWWWLAIPTVDLVHPTRGPAVEAVYATGTVEPTVMTAIAPRIGARIVALATDEGAAVTKGQVLARLENDDVRAALRQLQAQEGFARRDYLRYAALAKDGLIARAVFDKAKADWQAAREAVASARAQADYMVLAAPGDCQIIRRDGEVGQYIPVNQTVFWLSCDAPLRITADVDEEDVAMVASGQAVLIRADAFPGRVFQANVTSVTPKGDSVARSYRVRIGLSAKTPLRIGMTAEANIVIRKEERALLVPTGSLTGRSVWVVQGGRLVAHAVTVGVKGTDRTEIRAGLRDSDLIVRAPQADFRDGMRVRVQP